MQILHDIFAQEVRNFLIKFAENLDDRGVSELQSVDYALGRV